jgi:hypothetical protein
MAYMFAIGDCAACGNRMGFNPDRVPSIRVNGKREPLCRSCAERWGEIHHQPVNIHPHAYEPEEVA